jgi:hypothetical protein
MGTQTRLQRRPCIELQSESLAIAARADARESTADIARSEENILRWISYLPEDCIRTMVLMGWDMTT